MRIRYLFVALLVISLVVLPVSGLKVTGSKFMGNVTPGIPTYHKMGISVGQNDPDTTVFVDVKGFGQTADQNYVPTDTPTPFITTDKKSVVVKPNTTEFVTVTINVPNGTNGGVYALVRIHTAPSNTSGSSIVSAVVVPILATVVGSDIRETAEINNVTYENGTVTTYFTNTGNHHYYGAYNKFGNSSTKPSPFAIVPGSTVKFTVPINESLGKIDSEIWVGNKLIGVSNVSTQYPGAEPIPVIYTTPPVTYNFPTTPLIISIICFAAVILIVVAAGHLRSVFQ